MSSRVATLAWEFMHEPGDILIEPESVTVDKITQELYHISKEEKTSLLLGLLAKEKPQNAIIFTNTKHDAVKLSKRLNINGYRAEFIIGDSGPKEAAEDHRGDQSGDSSLPGGHGCGGPGAPR
jgi:ATP-dependent RNA helicase RhlB